MIQLAAGHIEAYNSKIILMFTMMLSEFDEQLRIKNVCKKYASITVNKLHHNVITNIVTIFLLYQTSD